MANLANSCRSEAVLLTDVASVYRLVKKCKSGLICLWCPHRIVHDTLRIIASQHVDVISTSLRIVELEVIMSTIDKRRSEVDMSSTEKDAEVQKVVKNKKKKVFMTGKEYCMGKCLIL